MTARFELKGCSDQQLLTTAKTLASQEREATAQLIAHLSEIDARGLYLGEGCPSLFKYCTEVLHLSEAAAGNRIIVARLAQKFPAVLERLAEGAIHLSALRILAPCLTRENHLALLDRAKHKSKEEVEQIAATVRPRPDVPSVVRKLPERGAAAPSTHPNHKALFDQKTELTPKPIPGTPNEPSEAPPSVESIPDAPVLLSPPRRATVSALSPGRYKIEFTADAETHEALRQLQELMRHQVPNGDPAKIFKKALFLLLEQVREDKTGQVKRPRKYKAEVCDFWMEKEAVGSRAEGPTQSAKAADREHQAGGKERARESRHIPAEVKRSVWSRDKGQCTFVGRNGRRCMATGWLEYHHVHAYALGGPSTIDNIALRCRAHNAYESRILFAGNGKKLTSPGACSGTTKQVGRSPGS